MVIASIVASIVSTILGCIAIALAIYIYTQSKNTENSIASALEGIRAQTNALQKITGRQMERLTEFVTQPRETDDQLIHILDALKEMLPISVASKLETPDFSALSAELVNEIISSYIAVYYYACISNYCLQSYLPHNIEDLKDDSAAKRLVDQSYADISFMEKLINGIELSLLQANKLYHLYDEASVWKAHTRDSTTVYRDRDRGSAS